MFAPLTDLRKAFWYYAIALGLCIGVAILSPFLGEHTLTVVMFTPLVAALTMLMVVTRDGLSKTAWLTLGVHRLGVKGWALALLLPLLVLSFAYGAVWLSGLAAFVVPQRLDSIPYVALDLLLSIVVVTLFGAFGEEVGWRGYFLPRLIGLGVRRALLLSGLLHGLWHLPIMIGTPFYHGMGDRLIVVPLFLLTLTVAGVCYGYLRLTTGSVWPAAIAHSAFNIFWERFNAATAATSPLALEYLAGESGLLTLGALTVVAGWLVYRLSKHIPSKVRFEVTRD